MTPRRIAIAWAMVSLTACGHAPARAADTGAAYEAKARADSVHRPWTTADVSFVSGMIHHHAQALIMAAWAPSHGASAAVQTLCARIMNSQKDEIARMQTWLRDRRQPVPGTASMPADMVMNGARSGVAMPGGAEGGALMPGMLSSAQMQQLDAARGRDFDQLFLLFMIQHHQGAVAMVSSLFASQGAAQDEFVFKLATDINVDQTTEISRMTRMLATLPSATGKEP